MSSVAGRDHWRCGFHASQCVSVRGRTPQPSGAPRTPQSCGQLPLERGAVRGDASPRLAGISWSHAAVPLQTPIRNQGEFQSTIEDQVELSPKDRCTRYGWGSRAHTSRHAPIPAPLLSKEGQGWLVFILVLPPEPPPDLLQNVVQLLKDHPVLKTEHGQAQTFQSGLPIAVVIASQRILMDLAVQLDHNVFCRAIEIDHIAVDGLLAAKLPAFKPSSLENAPEPGFGWREAGAQGPAEGFQVFAVVEGVAYGRSLSRDA